MKGRRGCAPSAQEEACGKRQTFRGERAEKEGRVMKRRRTSETKAGTCRRRETETFDEGVRADLGCPFLPTSHAFPCGESRQDLFADIGRSFPVAVTPGVHLRDTDASI